MKKKKDEPVHTNPLRDNDMDNIKVRVGTSSRAACSVTTALAGEARLLNQLDMTRPVLIHGRCV